MYASRPQVSGGTTVSLAPRGRQPNTSDRSATKNRVLLTLITERFQAYTRATDLAIAYDAAVNSADVPSFSSRLR